MCSVCCVHTTVMEHLDDTVSEHDLSIYAQKCVLMPPLLARKLRIDESTLQDIMYNHPKDRYEQIYQVLWRWKQSEPNATWRDLQQATDSGVKRVLEHLYSNGDSDDEGLGRCVQEESHGVQECHPPPTKIRRRGGSPVPSAPPFELVHPIKGAAMFSHNVINGGGRGICIQETEKDSGSSKKGEENESFHDNSQELTCKKHTCAVCILYLHVYHLLHVKAPSLMNTIETSVKYPTYVGVLTVIQMRNGKSK